MSRGLATAATLIMLTMLAAPAAQAGQDAPAVSREKAVELYTANCQVCHGPNGTGSALMKGSAFAGRAWKHGTTQAAVVKTITNGVQGTMMLPFKEKLSADEIAALASLVRSFDPKLKPAGAKK